MDVVSAHAAHRPHADALVATNVTLTWIALERLALKVALALREAGVSSRHRLAILGGTPAQLAVALLGASRLAPCMPLPGDLKEEELRTLLASADIGSIVDLDARGSRLPTSGRLGHIELSLSLTAGTCESRGTAGPSAQRVDAALLMPTSGTSGTSKIVPISHARMLHGARTIATALDLQQTDRCLNLLPLFHVGGQFMAVFCSWVAGAAALCVEDPSRPDLLASARTLAPTWLCAVPTILKRLAHEQGEDARALGLSFVHSGAAPLEPTDQLAIEHVFGAPIVQSYGMTETLMISCNPRDSVRRKPGSVGLPRQNVRILDADGSPVPAGQRGEVVVAGGSVMPGYLARGDARFWDSHLRTGDLGYFDEDGYLVLSGRAKEIINRGGEKIIPSEVDAALQRHPAVEAALAFGVAHEALGEDVAACVVLRSAARASEAELRAFAATLLSPHKVPRRILIVSELPENRTGKLVRSGLAARFAAELSEPGREGEGGALGKALSTLRSEARRRALAQWLSEDLASHLGESEVSTSLTFLELGLDSVGLVELRARLSRSLGFEVAQSVLFEHDTPQRLAAFIASQYASISAPPPPREGELERPLSSTEVNWLRVTEETGSGMILEGVVVRGPLDLSHLSAAADDVVSSQPMLQLTITGQGKRRHFMRASLPLQLVVHELPRAEIHAFAQREVHRRDFIPGAPLVEAHVVRFRDQPDEFALCFRANHSVWDGANDILDSLLRAYQRRLSGSTPELERHAPLPSIDVMIAQARSKRPHLFAKAAFVRDLATQAMPALEQADETSRSQHAWFELDAKRTARLQAFAQAQSLSQTSLYVGALAQAFRSHIKGHGKKRMTVLTMVDVREHVRPAVPYGLAGFFASAINSPVVMDAGLDALGAARLYHEAFSAAYASGHATDLFGMQTRLFTLGLDLPWLLGRARRSSTLGVSAFRSYTSLAPTYGPLTVGEPVIGNTCHGLGPCFMLYPVRYLDRTRCWLIHPAPLIADSVAQDVLVGIQRTLHGWAS
jgi:acyl-CoA synthetase (AMP-forming)/AMP-acid ligase II/acyl carrier protein